MSPCIAVENIQMCRIFGFRSVINSQVHSSLIEADNALEQQSAFHPDGWGVSYYLNGAPHVIKSSESALNDNLFQKVSGVVSSQTVLAHVRKATLGEKNILNTHPFQFGKWTFAHNGNIKNFKDFKQALLNKIAPNLKRFMLGNTDSELLFFFLLSYLQRKSPLEQENIPIEMLARAVRDATEEVIHLIGDYSTIDDAGEDETYLTFLITNGSTMLAHQGGKHLNYSTYKKKCIDRDICSSFSKECESPTKSGFINHLIFSSEPLSGENIWTPMKLGEIVGVDHTMQLKTYSR